MDEINQDRELSAIAAVLAALKELNETERQNVLDYVFRRLGISQEKKESAEKASREDVMRTLTKDEDLTSKVIDIRSLKESKNPKSAIEMVAVVGYYLEYLAPEGEKKTEITKSDIDKGFKQAGFPVPKGAHMTLVHAKNAGYFDQKGTGTYRLNPVGYNLVVHKLPGGGTKNQRGKV